MFWKRWLSRDSDGIMSPQEYFSVMPPLETQRLLLRRIRRQDAGDYYAYASDPEVARYVLWDAHHSLRETRGIIRNMRLQYRLGLPGSYAMVLKETGRMIGTIGFNAWHPDADTVEIGYSIARDHWGRGYASEALKALLAQCFRVMKVHRVEAVFDVDNPASGQVMAHCGMQREGIFRKRVLNKGEWRDVCVCTILSDDPVSPP